MSATYKCCTHVYLMKAVTEYKPVLKKIISLNHYNTAYLDTFTCFQIGKPKTDTFTRFDKSTITVENVHTPLETDQRGKKTVMIDIHTAQSASTL